MIRLLSGDCRSVLATLPADSVHCVVTSPPYYGLRDYGTALWDGGDAACSHLVGALVSSKSKLRLDGREHVGPYDGEKAVTAGMPFRDTCGKCGAVRIDRQIGLEATPGEYLATMVGVFREIRRVMRNDAVAFINMGDSYSDKQLLLMPARLALALQADGWWVRSDIIIAKKNPMPESCRDRPTSAHEHVFLLTKNARYYFDPDAVREPQTEGTIERFGKNPLRSLGGAKLSESGIGIKNNSSMNEAVRSGIVEGGRNIRNVWTLSTESFSGAHFATFPPALADRCIRAGTSERGCCAQCGKPWQRITETDYKRHERWFGTYSTQSGRNSRGTAGTAYNEPIGTRTTGWRPSCTCDLLADLERPADPVPCTVLDPFAGAGTTLLCADRLQRDAIGIELNVDYTRMAMDRVRADAPLLVDAPVPEPPEDARMADLFDMAAD